MISSLPSYKQEITKRPRRSLRLQGLELDLQGFSGFVTNVLRIIRLKLWKN
uniref:Leucine rich pentatricopeptide repeat containing n=1 Tax=Rhinopithecus bieti TaxID=61621 RepID=A0A2K6KUD5_RHIBE